MQLPVIPERTVGGSKPEPISIAIDRGGTFTDIWASRPGSEDVIIKLLSIDPEHYKDAPTEGIRRVLSHYLSTEIPRSSPLPKSHIHSIRMGTTVATNALLERKGTRHAFLVTKGLGDLLEIGSQQRPNIFDLNIRKPDVLYDKVVEIEERITIEGYDEDTEEKTKGLEEIPGVLVRGASGDMIRILEKLDEEKTREALRRLREEGINCLAICLAHSFLYPNHEQRVAELAKEVGFGHISLSSAVGANMIKMVARGGSASADAYLTPETTKYIQGFASRFEGGNLDGLRCEFMQSDGGLVSHKAFGGLRGILSGPAGGVVGYARTSFDGKTPVVGFDMGGTSTDVSRFGGTFDHVFETTTAGVTIQSPQLDINTVAAGGGSILSWQNGLFKVGPESASAHPGPASYRKGGPLTVTDANLLLGRLIPDYFPKIFGPSEDQPLDVEIVKQKFSGLTKEINADSGRSLSPEEVASGFLEVANEAMCRPIRALTEARGYEISSHNLAVFGGAGGQHACEIAENLGITRVVMHKYSSILSAYGMALAEVIQEAQEPSSETLEDNALPRIQARHKFLREKVDKMLVEQEVPKDSIKHEVYLNLRYQGSDTKLMVLEPKDGDWKAAFIADHYREFAFVLPAERKILVDDIRIRGIAKSDQNTKDNEALEAELREGKTKALDLKSVAVETRDVYFKSSGSQQASVLLLKDLTPGSVITGPAMIIDNTQTIVVTPGSNARILKSHIIIDTSNRSVIKSSSELVVDPIQLSVFGHRFMSIAEQMGRALRKTCVSLNIKERLDFACAIFGPTGDLVANAPHVPIFLGSMSYAVKGQIELLKGQMKPGDVYATNHPEQGGTHLPDITVITPVFDSANKEIIFFLASRGHHTDIGGLGGTSMPPNSTELWQEGAAIRSFTMIRDGKFDETETKRIFAEPAERPGCNAAQKVSDNITDLQAMAAANNKGVTLLKALIEQYSQPVVHFYMDAIQSNAEIAVRKFLKSSLEKFGTNTLSAVGYMDNSSRIHLNVTLSNDGSATFDFTGTTPELYGNMNAPMAITYSGIIYCLRTMIGTDIPLNQGCLSPITIIIPKGCFLNPSGSAAVCAGNTHTSQRVCDTILQAFSAAAASQGCMNCVGFFGGEKLNSLGQTTGFGFSFGETICGGAGAGPGFNGAHAVHTHMTNTRITDAELMEKRYPVLMREFSIRRGSGGKGKWNGGDGCTRIYEALEPLSFSVITERRTTVPFGLEGGGNGERGANLWVRRGESGEKRVVNLGQRGMVRMGKGDQLVMVTPSGGGYGDVEVNGVSGKAEKETVGWNKNWIEDGVKKMKEVVNEVQYKRAVGSVANWENSQADF